MSIFHIYNCKVFDLNNFVDKLYDSETYRELVK